MSKRYSVKEIFYTLQGEGVHAGRPAVFCRFVGCNLWTGREEDRATAVCKFCDTDFLGGKKYDLEALVAAIVAKWPETKGRPYVVCTGGEPLLQLDENLISALHAAGFEVAVETNGTQVAPQGLDWICVSPKADTELKQLHGNELKVVYPQDEHTPDKFEGLAFDHFFIQPCDGVPNSTERAVEYCLANPQWSLSLQTHKILDIE